MMKTLTFSRQTNFAGRNGYMLCSGMELFGTLHENSMMISPLTSRGAVGRCDIEVPTEDIPALIALLQGFVRTPALVGPNQDVQTFTGTGDFINEG